MIKTTLVKKKFNVHDGQEVQPSTYCIAYYGISQFYSFPGDKR